MSRGMEPPKVPLTVSSVSGYSPVACRRADLDLVGYLLVVGAEEHRARHQGERLETLIERAEPAGVALAARLSATAHRLDATRPVTAVAAAVSSALPHTVTAAVGKPVRSVSKTNSAAGSNSGLRTVARI